MDLHHAHLTPLSIEEIYRFLYRFGSGAHYHNDFLGIRRAIVIEQLVVPAGQLANLVHIVLNGVRNNGALDVGAFLALEVYTGLTLLPRLVGCSGFSA